MRRSISSLLLALVIAIPVVGPAAAADPSADPGAATSASSEPSVPPTPEPTAEPSGEPTAEPDPDPTPTEATDPTATPEEEPSTDPADDPTTDPAPAADPAPTAASSTEGDVPVDAKGRPDPTGRYIVLLDSTADPAAVARRTKPNGKRVDRIRTFTRAVRAFSAKLDAAQRRELRADPDVVAVVPDEVIELTAQTTPTGVSRVGGKLSPQAAINGVDQRVDADVAIVDTGIASVADLNVVGGYNCSTSDRTLWRDKQGHGTHVAGTVAALDNDFGVVGVAPGARLWAVKILNDSGYGLLSWYVCGLDWIAAQRDPDDSSRPLFVAVNMSVAKDGADDKACGTKNKDVLHAAICRVTAAGITVVAAAANDSGSASHRVPAAYNEVITVSALADTDGKPGALGGKRCYSWGTYDKDDTFANFSNYGHDVDLIAPGKCIWSTLRTGSYGYSSGTSMAAPAVTGAVALYKSTRPMATPAQVKEALQYLGNLNWKTSTDPDSTHEKLLDVSRIAKLGTFSFAAASVGAAGESGGTISIPVDITRSSTHFERVKFSVLSKPSGWTATFTASSIIGWTAKRAMLKVSVPAGTKAGTYEVRIRATSLGQSLERNVQLAVTNDDPTARAATIRVARWSSVGVSNTVPTTVVAGLSWSAATDPSSKIAGYEVQHRLAGGTWSVARPLSASARSMTWANLTLGATHEFRIRARDAVGNLSSWVTSPGQRFGHISDRSSAVTRTGSWTRSETSVATHGVRSTSTRRGSQARLSFTGKGIALVMPRSKIRGKVDIYIDGSRVGSVDTRASTSQARSVVWSTRWSSVGSHKIYVVVLGTSGRPTVSVDGFIVTN
jgi:subtilisin family serine protease